MKRFFMYFGLSRREQRGFVVLMTFVFFIFLFPLVFQFFDQENTIEHHIIYFPDQVAERNNEIFLDHSLPRDRPSGERSKRKITYFNFDPNGLAIEDWMKLGFSDKQIAVIKKYEAKGGKFYKKEDVAKIYVISPSDYERIAPYIVIPEMQSSYSVYRETVRTDKREPYAIPIIDINSSDTTDFKKLRGIGTVLAARIVKYREVLGGFHDVTQVGEVYGVIPEVFADIQAFLKIEEEIPLKKINVNTLSADQISRHPYISGKQAKLIVNYRTQHGRYENITDMRKIPVLDDVFFRKIEPYIEW